MIFIYLLLIFSIGPNILYLLNKCGIISLKKLNNYEIISTSMLLSLLTFVLYLYIVGMMSIKYTNILVTSFLMINVVVLLYLILFKKIKLTINVKHLKFNKEIIFTIILLSGIIIYLMYFISKSISIHPIYPDEFSAWLLNAKNIYIGRKMTLFMNTGFENYPNFLPLLSSGYYLFVQKIVENDVRIFSSIYLIITLIGMLGFAKRKKIDTLKLLIMFLFVISSYSIFMNIVPSSYVDIPFMATYTIGMLYLMEWLSGNRSNELLVISSISLMSTCFMKTDGLYLMAFNIFLFVIFMFFHKKLKLKKVEVKTAIIYNLSVLWLPITWKLYNIICHFPNKLETGAGSVFELHLEYTVSLFQHMTSQISGCITWLILLTIGIIGWYLNYHKLNKKNKIFVVLALLTVLANILFLIVCYYFVFGAEALIAASFIRYMTRIVFIMAMICLLLVSSSD